MATYDRDYMRRTPGWRSGGAGFWARSDQIVWVFIAISVVLFLLPLPPGWGEFTSRALARGEVWTLLSYQFLHTGIFHLGFNMVALFFVGRSVASGLGVAQFTWIYFAGGGFGAIFEWALQSAVGRPTAIVGASASISALFFVSVILEPRLMVRVFPLPFPITLVQLAWGFMAINGVLGLVGLFGPNSPGALAYLAHIGGALYGLLHGKYFRQNIRFTGFKRKARRPAPAPPPVSYRRRPGQPNVIEAEFSEAKGDYNDVLDKINREGIGSLTPAERRILEQASENLGRRND